MTQEKPEAGTGPAPAVRRGVPGIRKVPRITGQRDLLRDSVIVVTAILIFLACLAVVAFTVVITAAPH
jgi:hypothetical protein